jgi:hypothetical protein
MPPFQVDLSKPLGSCPLPDITALPTSFTAKSPATANAPGFKVEVKGGTLTTVYGDSVGFPYRHGVSVTMVNNDSLDPLNLYFGEDGTGVMALTDKGYLMPVGNRVDGQGCEVDGFALGPGQTATWNLCFWLTVLRVDVGSPIALLFVAPTGAYGLARLTS